MEKESLEEFLQEISIVFFSLEIAVDIFEISRTIPRGFSEEINGGFSYDIGD